MISAADYYSRIVRPTVDEFCARDSDVRLAMLACMATLHVVDHIVQNRMTVTTKREAEAADREVMRLTNSLSERHFPFAVVRAYGTASKHGRIGLQRKFQPGFDTGRGLDEPPEHAFKLAPGLVSYRKRHGGIIIQWEDRAYATLSLTFRKLLPILEDEFPEIVGSTVGLPSDTE